MRLVGALLVAGTLVACGGSATPRCTAEPAASATPNPNADPELADTFPDTVAGVPLEVATFCVNQLGELGGIETSEEMLAGVGVSLDELTIAAVPPDFGTPGGSFSIGAYRFAGANEEVIRDTFFGLLATSSSEIGVDPHIEEATIGGKAAHRALGIVFYVSDDVLYSVQGAEATVEAILEALP